MLLFQIYWIMAWWPWGPAVHSKTQRWSLAENELSVTAAA